MPQRATNTQEEVLRKMLNQLTEAELAEDADPAFIALLRKGLIGKLREPMELADQAAAQQIGIGAPDPTAGLPPSLQQPMQQPTGAQGIQTGVNRPPGGIQSLGATSPDEIRRMLTPA